jgi:hypothetical protein
LDQLCQNFGFSGGEVLNPHTLVCHWIASLNKTLKNKQEEEKDSVINDVAAELRPIPQNVYALKTES